ncbi:hypothetical protein [Stenotrophomonas sp. SMYL36]|uniref:hypothetical protein n=1 Tax=Stenotrophomonas sp. SMYL36 TaxID=3076045 RepID=UPI002E78CA4D|nr:hypothetical protein [Stenotrophomonas sp. SMYL36]
MFVSPRLGRLSFRICADAQLTLGAAARAHDLRGAPAAGAAPRAHAHLVAAAVAARRQGRRRCGYCRHQTTSQLLTQRDRPSCQTSHTLPST